MVSLFNHNSAFRTSLLWIFLFLSFTASGQFIDLAFQTKFYPAGSIYGLRAERKVNSQNSIALMVGYNILYHRDLGVHEDERGGGPGLSLNYRQYGKNDYKGLFLGIMLDVYGNHVNFKDNINTLQQTQGSHDVIVIQPLTEIGYMFFVQDNKYRFGPYMSFGWEINATYFNVKSTNANDVANPASGEGSMLIIGFTFGLQL